MMMMLVVTTMTEVTPATKGVGDEDDELGGGPT
jgi:hypothetical protein